MEFQSKACRRISNNKNYRGGWFSRDILSYFPEPLKSLLATFSEEDVARLEEIRLRVGKPVMCQFGGKNYCLTSSGQKVPHFTEEAFLMEFDIMQKTIALISHSSFYALETELAQGYLTLQGGHRVGFTGEAILEKGRLKAIKHLSSLNFRIAREIPGAANVLVPALIDKKNERVYHTLLVSPPRAGKTTILRDLIRQLSDGIPGIFEGINVGLVDERSEIAGCFQGIPQNDIGLQTDVLDACPKAEGMMLLLRSMSPQVIAVDELGREEDVISVLEILNAGVSVIATAHGHELEELKKRPILGELMRRHIFERIVFLSRRLGPGTIERILDTKAG